MLVVTFSLEVEFCFVPNEAPRELVQWTGFEVRWGLFYWGSMAACDGRLYAPANSRLPYFTRVRADFLESLISTFLISWILYMLNESPRDIDDEVMN